MSTLSCTLGFPIVVPVSSQSQPDIPTVPITGQFATAGLSLGGFQLSVDPDRKDPRLYQWTFSVERELPRERPALDGIRRIGGHPSVQAHEL